MVGGGVGERSWPRAASLEEGDRRLRQNSCGLCLLSALAVWSSRSSALKSPPWDFGLVRRSVMLRLRRRDSRNRVPAPHLATGIRPSFCVSACLMGPTRVSYGFALVFGCSDVGLSERGREGEKKGERHERANGSRDTRSSPKADRRPSLDDDVTDSSTRISVGMLHWDVII